MTEDKYFYELKYVSGDTEIIHKFNAAVDSTQLVDNIKYFLLACSWTPQTIDENILRTDE